MRLFALFGLLSLFILACGDDESSKVSREFGQGVDKVVYDLKSLDLKIDLGSDSKSLEHLQRSAQYSDKRSTDQIVRKIDGSAFRLQINEKIADIQVSSQENIEHHQAISENSPACQLDGSSKVSGSATSLSLELDWNLTVRLEGDGCGVFTEKFKQFLSSELERFHLKTVDNLLNAADFSDTDQRVVNIALHLQGESS